MDDDAEVPPVTDETGEQDLDVQPADDVQQEDGDLQIADDEQDVSVELTADATVESAIDEAVAFVEEAKAIAADTADVEPVETEGPSDVAIESDNIIEPSLEQQEDLGQQEQKPDFLAEAHEETLEPEQDPNSSAEAQQEPDTAQEPEGLMDEAHEMISAPEFEEGPIDESQEMVSAPEPEEGPMDEPQEIVSAPEPKEGPMDEIHEMFSSHEPEEGPMDEPQETASALEPEEGPKDEPQEMASALEPEEGPKDEPQEMVATTEPEAEQKPDSLAVAPVPEADDITEQESAAVPEQGTVDAPKEIVAEDDVTEQVQQPPVDAKEDMPSVEKPSEPADVTDNTVQMDDNDFNQGFSAIDSNAAATVKFMLMPCAQVTTRRCFLNETVLQLKEHFAEELRIPANVILLLFDGQTLSDDMTLLNMGVGPNSTVQLEMQSADPINIPIKAFRPRQEYHMPDVITVRVPAETGNAMMDIVVEIERCTQKKPFLGGYRHKETGTEYHHASAQTNKKVKPPYAVEHFCRDTQTVQEKLQYQQTTNNMTTQMTKVGVFVATATDRLVAPGTYTTADEYHARRLEQVLVIQKYYRRWLARCYVQQVRRDAQRRLDWEREQELRKKKEKEDRIRLEFERRMNPKSKEDFDLLYHALEKWRQEEVVRINEELCGAERKAALCQLLEQETQLIASIGQHKIDANIENKNESIKNFLDKTAAPKRWRSYDGRMMAMATPYTLRATELKEIYNSINMKYLTQDERLDVLLTLKHTVKEHNCKLTRDLISLVDREADLLLRGVQEANLVGLRKRISTLFLQYIRTPSFNPEAARMLKVPQDPLDLIENIYYCSCCNQYLPSSDFQLSTNSRSVGHCRLCRQTDNVARQRQDLSHYRYMLQALRKSEEAYDDDSKIAFLMQENDLRHLVENVWSSQSALSAWEDLYDLVLVRWEKSQEWSPWNCVLLTKEEATAHNNLVNLTEAYGKIFIQKVQHKQTLARNYFSRLPGMAEQLRNKVSSKSQRRAPYVTGIAVKQPVA